MIGAALLLTYSRGGLAVAVIGLVVYAVLGRPRGLLSALIATGPTSAIAMKDRLRRHAALRRGPTSPPRSTRATTSARDHRGCALAALVLPLRDCCSGSSARERALAARPPPPRAARRRARDARVAIVVALALGAPGEVLTAGTSSSTSRPRRRAPLVRNRLSSASNDGRIELWTIALDAFRAHPLDGTGAETYEILYYEHRTTPTAVVNAHSLYIETLGELGLVGLIFVLHVRARHARRPCAIPPRPRSSAATRRCSPQGSPGRCTRASTGTGRCRPCRCPSPRSAGSRSAARRRGGRRRRARVDPRFVVGAAVVAAAVAPALVLASQVRLNDATERLLDGRLRERRPPRARSIAALGTRAPPWQIWSSATSSRRYRQALRRVRSGLARPRRLGAAGRAGGVDGRRRLRCSHAAAAALALNPIDPGVMRSPGRSRGGPSAGPDRPPSTFLSDQTLISSG